MPLVVGPVAIEGQQLQQGFPVGLEVHDIQEL
jgi:hypothetical protein